MKLENKTALITGAASGLGREMALRFAEAGARIVAADLNEAKNQETAQMIHAQGGEALAFTVDVGSSSAVAQLFEQLDQRGWQVDVLINNAGQGGALTPVHEMSDEMWDALIATHLNGTFYCTREAIRRLLARQTGGAIINLGSVAGLRGLPGGASYTAAKAGIIGFTKGVAQEVAQFGIRVNCIAPGWVETPILENLPPQMRDMIVTTIPLGRIGQPADIAALALFLAGEESGYIIGQIISPNGGLHT
jgi:NAD(P)-dependent dehydrogenase (short-subunit alcohol dehydrogenase family)